MNTQAAALRALMATVIEVLPPRLGDELNRMGWEWDKALDALDSEFKSKSPAQEPGAQQGQMDANLI